MSTSHSGYSLRADERTEGARQATAQTLLLTLETRGVPVDDLSRRRILTCQDLATLQRWMVRAIKIDGAPTLADVFG